MHTVMYIIAAVLGLFGAMWLIASAQGNTLVRIIIGIVMLGVAAVLVYIARTKTPDTKIVQEIDLSGDVSAEQMECKACGGKLSSENMTIEGGAIFVECPYCGTEYQLEEEPKW